jgi:hypothetical protein
MHCTLFVPDLLTAIAGPASQPAVAAPHLHALLARGNAAVLPAAGAEQWLCETFGIARQHDWPVAALTLAADGGGDPGDHYWLRCDPVHLQITRNRMRLSTGIAAPAAAEAQALVDALNTHFQADGLVFFAGPAGRWYLRTDTHTALTTCSLAEAATGALDACMPGGKDSAFWRGVVNEIQMLLHAHAVNAAREQRGLPAFNSVWLWGGGRRPAVTAAPYTGLWADELLARALATHSNTPVADLPASARTVIESNGAVLVVLTALRDAGDEPAMRCDAVSALERDWFAPCYRALKERRLEQLTIISSGRSQGRRIDITRANLWRWWRRTLSSAADARHV